jgi:hypothetical protein
MIGFSTQARARRLVTVAPSLVGRGEAVAAHGIRAGALPADCLSLPGRAPLRRGLLPHAAFRPRTSGARSPGPTGARRRPSRCEDAPRYRRPRTSPQGAATAVVNRRRDWTKGKGPARDAAPGRGGAPREAGPQSLSLDCRLPTCPSVSRRLAASVRKGRPARCDSRGSPHSATYCVVATGTNAACCSLPVQVVVEFGSNLAGGRRR